MIGSSKFVGASVKRREDPRLITGQGHYVGGIKLPGMLDLAVLRSSHAHARILSIDTTAALAHPGVYAVYTGADLQKRMNAMRSEVHLDVAPDFAAPDMYPLTPDKVRYVGEGVAAVVADDRYVAEDALALIEVDYEILDATMDAEKTLEDGAPVLHETRGHNILNQKHFSAGDPDGAFARAHLTIKRRFRTNRQAAVPIETQGAVASWVAATDELTVWATSQTPHTMRTKLAELMDLPGNKIRVIAPDVGGGFGLKAHFCGVEVVCCLASRDLGRPVRWIEDRRENLCAALHAKQQIVDAELAVAEDGTLLAARLKNFSDSGAYSAYPQGSIFEALHVANMFPSVYRLQDYAYSAYASATNKSTSSAYRGVGAPITTFAMESMLDLAARELGIDPLEIRRKNLIRKEEFPYTTATGMVYEIGSYVESLEKAAELVDYEGFRREQKKLRESGIYRGIGICCYNEVSAFNSKSMRELGMPSPAFESANVKLDPSGRATVFTGTHSHGQAHETTFAQIAADELGLPVESVVIRLGDTRDTPYGAGTFNSRCAIAGGGAVKIAAGKVADKLRRIAGHWLEVSPDDIELAEGKAQVKGVPGRELSIAEITKRAIFTHVAELPEGEEPGLEVTHYYEPPAVTFPNAAHIVTIEVDIETGFVKILRWVAVEDCGKMINPMVVGGQVLGGIAQGLGGALLEDLVYDEYGQLLTTSLMDYLLPSAADVPFVELAHIETPSPLVPGGFKGAGEGGAIAPWGALGNAVTDALRPVGGMVCELPLSPERVRQLVSSP